MPNPCRSASEILGGGLALAIVTLIAVSSAHIAPPQASLPAEPLHYATTAIEPSEEVAKLSLSELDQPADTAGRPRDAPSSDPVPNSTAALEPVVPVRAPPPPPQTLLPAAVPSAPLTTRWSVARGIEATAGLSRPGAEAGPARRSADAVEMSPDRRPGLPPGDIPSRSTPVPARARAAPTFVGAWSDDISRCGARRETPLVISLHAAKTANGECDFGSVAREAENRWRVAAICTSEGEYWRANIALKIVGPKLTWSSERGTETYVRCKP